MNGSKTAAVVVPMYQDGDTIGSCLDSLARQTIADRLEIIVVDDGSRDDGPAIAAARGVRVIRQANGGPAAARNAGARAATAPLLLFLDADCTAPPNWAEAMVRAFADGAATAAMGTIAAAETNPLSLLVQTEVDERYRRLEGRDSIDFIASVSCAADRARFLALGGFREDFRYNEDVEFSYRINAAKGRIRFVPDAPVAHVHPSRWLDYAKSKFWRGVWRMRLYRLYPSKLVRDDWTPPTLKFQVLTAALLPALLAVSLVLPVVGWLVPTALLFIVLLDARHLGIAMARLAPHWPIAALPLSAAFVVVRAVALAAAVVFEAGSRLVAKAPAAAALLALGLAGAPATAQPAAVTVQVGGKAESRGVPAVYRYGGGVWNIPKMFDFVDSDIEEIAAGGTIRAALAWEVLAASQSAGDLQAKLAGYKLNDFLQRVARRGARVMITLDATPRWLASNQSTERLPDGPAWAKSPPRDANAWAAAVETVVRHFNGTLGLDAYYEVWNEPDGSFRGKLQQYFELYRATVVGARRADPKARIGGPGISDWSATGTPVDRQSVESGFFLQKFLRYAAATNAPEVGLSRLPVDFVSWHGFYRDPSVHYAGVVPAIEKWVKESGGTAQTPLIISEWNIAAEPPYPEGDLNGSHVGAAYVGASIIEMARAGVDRQVFQMMVDPGGDGYSGGTFTVAGLPRGNHETFRLFARLQGEGIATTSADPWVHAAAFHQGSRLQVLVVTSLPTERMHLRGAFELLPASDPPVASEMARMDRNRLQSILVNGAAPDGLSPRLREALTRGRNDLLAFRGKSQQWQGGVEIRVQTDARWSGYRLVRHEVIDEERLGSPATLAQNSKRLAETMRAGVARAQQLMSGAGIDQASQKRLMDQIADRPGSVPQMAGTRREFADAYRAVTDDYRQQRSAAVEEWRRRVPGVAAVNAGPSFRSRAHAVHLLTFEGR